MEAAGAAAGLRGEQAQRRLGESGAPVEPCARQMEAANCLQEALSPAPERDVGEPRHPSLIGCLAI